MADRRVVITGIGVATPLGWELDAFWSALIEKRSGIRRIEAFDPTRFVSQVGGEIPKFILGDYVPKSYRKSAKVMSRDIMISMVAAHRACQDAGLRTKCMIDRGEVDGPTNVDPTRFGANIGAGLICADVVELATALGSAVDDEGKFNLRLWGEGMSNLTPLWLLKFLPNMLACHVTIVHDAQAPSNTLTCSEASSHLAIGEAYLNIQRGAADVCICGGVESKMNPMSFMRQDVLNRLSTAHNDDPATACRPFDATRSGTVAAEGGGLLILESLEHAQARDARIYGEISGFGASCNTTSWREPEADGAGIAMAMRKALEQGGVSPSEVDLLTAFGTALPEFDQSEVAAIRGVFGDDADRIPALAIKGAVGNSGAGSGSIDLAAGILAMKHNTVPASVNTTALADDSRFNLVLGDATDARINTLLSTAYALSGGQTASILIRRFQE